ncbi:MAG: T9SS type A sorting domain-containing protein, partial [Bacteroidetes bacterium]|nr:T9SS type A sorting domain-containing protein [Bacteroidota bacterium]
MALNSDIAEVEAWDNDYRKHNIVLTQKVSAKAQEPKTEDQLVIYPNPNKGIFSINLHNVNTNKLTFVFTTIYGQKLFEALFATNSVSGLYNFNLNKKILLTKGIYFVSIKEIP